MTDPEIPSSSDARLLRALREARLKLEEAERRRAEPIALVGLACRFPGGADSPDAFWRLLREGRDAVCDLPAGRDRDVGGAWRGAPAHLRRGGFLEEVDAFDPRLFGIAPAEATGLDPQQRLLLEASWEALEDAGLDPRGLRGSAAGVWIGLSNADYHRTQMRASEAGLDAYTLTGSALSLAAGRLSYLYGLRGPAMVVDTACSSSLVALHLAVASLRAGECDLALVGGVQLILEPDLALGLDRMAALSPRGLCRTFDAGADGFVRGEGGAVVVLRRLSDAERRAEPVRAVILASAVNQDGASSGLTAPNGTAQRELMRAALDSARLSPEDVDYVEAHGTGTALGDPIELASLADVFGGRERPLAVGSVKTNLGHLEAAAGLAGLIKVALALEHGEIPPHLHLERPTPHFDWQGSPLEVTVRPRPWEPGERPRRAGISSFGFSGTNAHVVVAEAPARVAGPETATVRPTRPELLPLSARSEAALEGLRQRWAGWLDGRGGEELAAACHTARTGRAHLEHRRTWIGGSPAELAAALGSPGIAPLPGLDAGASPGVVWLFTGQGSQHPGMACGLYEAFPAFRRELDLCGQILEPYLRETGAPGLTSLLFESSAADLARTGLSQPAIVAVELALARLWQSWGIEPAAVLGHSVGELAAACVAGVFSREDALALVAARARALQELPDGGGMASVLADEGTVLEHLRPYGGRLIVAAVNGPRAVSVAGPAVDLDDLAARLGAAGIKVRRLEVSHAFHSPLVASALERLRPVAEGIRYAEPQVPVISPVTGRLAAAGELSRAGYWLDQILRPVRFADALTAADALGHRLYLEVGPAAVVVVMGMETLPGESRLWVPSLRQGKDDARQILKALGRLYVHGVEVDWAGFDGDREVRKVRVPTYAFDRQRYWRDGRDGRDGREGVPAAAVAEPAPAPAAVPVAPAAPAQDPREAVLARLLEMLAGVGGPAVEDLDVHENLFRLGLDSIMLIQARQLINREMGVDVELNRFFDEASTLDKLAGYIVARAEPGRLPGAPPVVSAALPALPAGGGEPTLAGIAAQIQALGQQLQHLAASPSAGKAPRPAQRVMKPAPDRPSVLPNRPGRSRSSSAEMAERQRRHLQVLVPRYEAKTGASKDLAARYRPFLASGRHLAGFRPEWKELVYQIAGGRGEGARIWDADGREYRDFTMGFGAALFGHGPDFVRQAVAREVERGMALGPLSDRAGETAQRLCDLTGVDRAAFFNTGTEAVMCALRIARTVTGRSKVALFEGSYHGMFDGVLALGSDDGAVPVSPGTTLGMVEDLIVLPYGDPAALDVIERHAGELAAVLVEPVQSRHPDLQPRDFLLELRRLTSRLDVALILDEMITGFRCHPAGIQGRWGVRADLVTYGKILGGGMPVGAVAGTSRFLDAVDGGVWAFGDDSIPRAASTFTSGTFCNHPLTMAAGGAVLARLQEAGPGLQEEVDARTERLCRRLDALFQAEGLPLHMARFSSLFRFVFEADLELLFFHLLDRGFYVWEGRNCFLSAAHTDEDVDALVDAVDDSLREMRAAGLVPEKRSGAVATGEVREELIVLPASPAQKRLFILDQLGGADVAYHLHEARIVHGPLDVDRLRAALAGLMAAHESLRTGFALVDGEPVQRVHARLEPAFEVLDRSGEDPAALVASLLRPFDLERPPLLRLAAVRLGADGHLFLIDVHHIICDGSSLALLFAELLARYRGESPPAPERQYRHYAEWHHALLASPEARRQEDYWRAFFDREAPVLDLPADFARPAALDFAGGAVRAEIGDEGTRRLKALARSGGATLYAVLLAAYQTLLFRLTGQRDLVIGTPVSGRPGAEYDRVIGMFVATLPLRLPLDPEVPFLDHLASTARALLTAFDHADYPFERLVEKLALPRDPGRNPLFDTMFEFEVAGDDGALEVPGLRFEPLGIEDGTAMFDLDVETALAGDRIRLVFKHRSRLLRRETAERFLRCYLNLLDAAAADPRQPLAALPLLDAAERRALLVDWNDTAVPFPDSGLHELFEAQARRAPDRVALIDELEGRERVLTYRQLDEAAGRLAGRLRGLGIGPERFVGIFMERSLELIVAFLGVLKAGGAYVPLDPEYPAQRIDLLTEDLGRPLVLAQSYLLERLPATLAPARVLAVDFEWRWLGEGEPLADTAVDPLQPAYALFTSGSTGRPKSVVVPHRSIVNHTLWYVRDLGVTADDVFLQKTVFTFDTSLTEIYAPLAMGCRLVLPRPREHADPAYVVSLIRRYGVTILEDVPSFTELLADEPGFEECRTLRWHNPGGEALTAALTRRILERLDVRMANMYGPTEAAVDSIYKVTDRASLREISGPAVPIGRPVSNMAAYVVDARMEPVPVGVAGELLLGGRSLGRGYFGRPDLTADRFIPDPLSGASGARLYRTGDLARWSPDRDVLFLGRLDHQVKIRGLRIELGEIEAALAAHERVETALVVHRPGARGGAQLVAYVVPSGERDSGELRAWLKERLPSYMVPSAFVFLAALPLTTSGKVDRKALPEPDETAAAATAGKGSGAGVGRRPRTPAEEIVAGVFAELLGVPEVGLDEDFFTLGGHSLLATQAVSRLRTAFGAALPLRALFESPTVVDLARVAGSLASGAPAELPPIGPAPEAGSYPLSSAQRAVWLACQMQDDATAYNMAEAYRIEGDLDADALERALTAMVARHEILRTVFVVEAGEPRQRVLPAATVPLERHDLSAEADPEAAALALCRESAAAPFDLATGPLFRAALFSLAPRRHALLFNLHHIVFDAWSTRVLIDEVLALYAGQPLPAPRRQYRDYAVWQTGLLEGGALAGARAYWHRQLTPPAPPLDLPTDRPRPRWRTLAGGQVHRTLDPGLTAELRRLGRAAGATLFMTLHAAVKVLLHALTGQRDLAVGTLWAGRFDEALEDQIGFYLNTLVLRDRLDPDEGFLGLLGRVRRTTLEGFEHGHYPYDRLVSELQGRRDPGRQPLFDVLVNQMDPELTGAGLESAGWEGMEVAPLPLGGQDAKFDLTWYLFERNAGDGVEVTLEYSADLFDAPTVERLADRFLRLLLWTVRQPEAPLAELELGDPAPLPPVLTGPIDGLEPLSPHQERLWFIDRFERGNVYAESPTYHNVPLLVRFEGEPDLALLELALGDLAARHEALRTRLVTREDRGWQAVEPPAPVRLRVLTDEPELDAAVIRETLRPFDLAQEVPARAVWLTSPGEAGRLLLVLHHALTDWATLDLLLRDLAELYAARAEGRAFHLPEPVPQPRDLARWQRTLPAEALETHLLYWRRELGGELKALELPTDRPRPAIHTFTAARHLFRLPAAAVQGLGRRCGEDSETALLAAFKVVLHRWAGHGEIVIGTAHPGREVEGTADLAGPVANLLVLRSWLAGDPPVGAVAAASGRTLARARRHAALPFDRLVLALRPDKDMSRTALFDVLFRVATPPVEATLPGGVRARREDLHLGWGKYDLYLCLTPGEGEWEGGLVYNADLFDPDTAERFARHLGTVVEAAASGSDMPVSRLPLLRPAERAELIASNRPRRAFSGEEPLHRRFRRRVQAAPAAPAVAAGGEILSYSELARRADRLAAELRRRGVGPENRVGVCAGRSAALIEAILAVLEAGGAYVPLDPGYPREHLAWTLADSGTRWLLADAESLETARSLAASLPGVEVLEVEALREGTAGPLTAPEAAPHPDQAAYVIYTSGSTGRPKGCVVTHRNAARLFDATDEPFGFGPGDTVPLFHSYAFDFSVWEIWAALAYGGRLVVVPDAVRKDPAVFAGLLVTEGVTVLNQTPSAFYPLAEQLAQTGAGRLRLVLFGGEALDFARLRPFFTRFGEAGPRLFNLYGITETTVHVTVREVTATDAEGRSGSRIGVPLSDLDLQVLDPWGEPLPEGLAGELWVGGAGLARGYLGLPGLTGDRFRPHPFAKTPGARLYRSGDLARRTADSDVEYLGRADHQIKVRGFRIEPGEIEAALAVFPGVRGALVMARDFGPGGPGDRRLVAYVEAGEAIPSGELRRHLLDRLPPHMVPAAFVRVDRFPLTANGKVDRDALPLPDRRGAGDGDEAVAPRTPVETVLAEIWQEVLGLERVGVHDDFFALGGDSILSIQILSRAARAGLELTTQAIFQYPTVAGLAAVARPRTPVHAEQGPVTGEVLPTPIQAWFFEQETPRPNHFNQSILLSVRGADPGRLERALEALAVHHDALRLRARKTDGGWLLDLLAPEEARLALEQVDLAGLPPESRRDALERRAAATQASLDLAAGRPAAAVLFHLGEESDRLLLAVHHLAIDGVSWRILLEDLDAVYRGLPLPAKTTSVKEWARRLHERAAGPEIAGEADAWLEVASRPAGPASFLGEEGDRVAAEASVTVRLTEAATAQLLGDALRAYGNRVDDFLLAGLVTVLGDGDGLRLDLEGHGRVPLPEAGGETLDLGRTVGWLTALYPVWLDAAAEPGALLKSVKERLRGVPSEGMGYGLLRHLRREPRLAALPPSTVLFNFHGRADVAFPAGSPFGPAPEDVGPQQDPAARRSHALEITGAVTGGMLELTWTYSAARHRREEIEGLAARHLAAVEALIRHGLDPAAGGYTPSDFPEAGFSQEELEDFLSEVQQPD